MQTSEGRLIFQSFFQLCFSQVRCSNGSPVAALALQPFNSKVPEHTESTAWDTDTTVEVNFKVKLACICLYLRLAPAEACKLYRPSSLIFARQGLDWVSLVGPFRHGMFYNQVHHRQVWILWHVTQVCECIIFRSPSKSVNITSCSACGSSK